jgi:hypothetical protein
MSNMNALNVILDPYLIWLFRITGSTFIDFLIGSFILGMIATVIGELTISLVFLINRKHIDETNENVLRYQNLAEQAAASGDRTAYKACNDLANEAFGQSFFMQIALSAASLWPAFLAMAWMDFRFQDVEFEVLFLNHTVGYPCVFIPLYAAARIVFKRIKYKIPYFARMKAILETYKNKPGETSSLADLMVQPRRSSS